MAKKKPRYVKGKSTAGAAFKASQAKLFKRKQRQIKIGYLKKARKRKF
jgi:hypothetical protein